jgi:endogenous inhibitor of DNA gyrase (YacG/DUF329 family)
MALINKCKICGKDYYTKKHLLEKGISKFCSRACLHKWRSKEFKGAAHPLWNKKTKDCKECGKSYLLNNYRHKLSNFCSRKCQHIWFSKNFIGQKAYHWQGGLIKKMCEECGAEYSVKKYRIRNGTGKFCSRECLGKHKTRVGIGENNPNWRGGLSFEPYPIQWRRSLRKHIRERDGRICQICKLHESEYDKKLDIHHIDYNKKNLDPANLISLCHSCHSKTSGNRECWIAFFNEKTRINPNVNS